MSETSFKENLIVLLETFSKYEGGKMRKINQAYVKTTSLIIENIRCMLEECYSVENFITTFRDTYGESIEEDILVILYCLEKRSKITMH